MLWSVFSGSIIPIIPRGHTGPLDSALGEDHHVLSEVIWPEHVSRCKGGAAGSEPRNFGGYKPHYILIVFCSKYFEIHSTNSQSKIKSSSPLRNTSITTRVCDMCYLHTTVLLYCILHANIKTWALSCWGVYNLRSDPITCCLLVVCCPWAQPHWHQSPPAHNCQDQDLKFYYRHNNDRHRRVNGGQ